MMARPVRTALAMLVAAAYVLALASIVGADVPIAVVLAVLLALLTVVHLGVFFLNLGVFVDVTSRGPVGRSAVALTFDDGPHPVHTRRVLELLAGRGHKATFFVVGEKAEAHPDVILEIVAQGHELALHGHSHDRFLNLREETRIIDDLRANQAAIERAASVRTRLFRPPVGFTSPRTRVAVRALDLFVVGWTARAYDGAGRPSAAQVVDRIERDLFDGSIILLHDAAERGDAEPASVRALPTILERLDARGLGSITVGELCRVRAVAAEAQTERAADPAAC
jgi:peptidoglycan/xylan/chitin deacetylase (PgdA/CDA1 family)